MHPYKVGMFNQFVNKVRCLYPVFNQQFILIWKSLTFSCKRNQKSFQTAIVVISGNNFLVSLFYNIFWFLTCCIYIFLYCSLRFLDVIAIRCNWPQFQSEYKNFVITSQKPFWNQCLTNCHEKWSCIFSHQIA